MQSTNIRQTLNAVKIAAALLALSFGQSPKLIGQDQSRPKKPTIEPTLIAPIEILDEPKTVDPATLVPPQLAVPVTVQFDGQPLKNVFTWLESEQSINILVDYKELANVKLLDTEPVDDELNDAPLYLLLNRLERLGLAWYVQDNSLQITSREEYLKHDTTTPYNLGDLFDAGYSPQDLVHAITHCCGGRWEGGNGSGAGTAVLLGDVVFVRQTDEIHREVAGLLAAIRKHARRTLTLDSPRHAALRLALDQKVTVDFQETPLIVAVQELARQAQIGIRLDRVALAKGSVRERTPVSLKLADQKLNAVLRSLLSSLGLTWYLRDDVLWITTGDAASQFQKTAVYDVRDLCRDRDESIALLDAIQKQTRAKWRTGTDRGGFIESPKPGILVARHTENALDEVLQLLENYRTALRASKLRVVAGLDPNEVIAGYYRLSLPMARSLHDRLPILILPETWQSIEHPDGIGTIMPIAAESSPADAKGNVVENLVLVIRQSRAAHQLIGKLIQTLVTSQTVDPNATLDTTKKPQGQTGSFGRGLIPAAAQ